MAISSTGMHRANYDKFLPYQKEYDAYRLTSKFFKQILEDLYLEESVRVIFGTVKKVDAHSFGKGPYFQLVNQMLKIKESDKTRYSSWFSEKETEILEKGMEEFSIDRKEMKSALCVLLATFSSRKVQSKHVKEEFGLQFTAQISNLTSPKDLQIDFNSILKLIQFEGSESPRTPRSESPRTPRSESPRKLSNKSDSPRNKADSPRRLTRLSFLPNKGSTTKIEIPKPTVNFEKLFSSSSPEKEKSSESTDDQVIVRAKSLPDVKANVIGEKPIESKKNINFNNNLIAIEEVLTGKNLALKVLKNDTLGAVYGEFKEDTIKIILNEFKRIFNNTSEDKNDYINKVKELMKSHVARFTVFAFNGNTVLYKDFVKFYFGMDFIPWLLDQNKYKSNMLIFHNFLLEAKIPNPFKFSSSPDEVIDIWKICDDTEVELVLTDIAIISNPIKGCCEYIQQSLRLSLEAFNRNSDHWKKLRSIYTSHSEKYPKDNDFILNLGKENDLTKIEKEEIFKVVQRIANLGDSLEKINHRDFPLLDDINKLLKTKINHIHTNASYLSKALKHAIGHISHDSRLKNTYNEELKLLLLNPIENFEEILIFYLKPN